MYKWVGSAKASFRRWKSAEKWSEQEFVSHADEDQHTDYEICAVTAARVESGGVQASLSSGSDKAEETFTVDDAVEAFGFGKFQFKMYFFTGLSLTADSMVLMMLSILGPQLHCEWKLNGSQVALIATVAFIGMMIGAPAWGYISDKYGRRVGLVMSMFWSFYFSLLTAFAPVYHWVLLLLGNIGFGLGGIHLSVGLLSEFLPLKSRGICLMLNGLFWAAGAVLEVLLAMWIMPTLGWRWLVALSTMTMAIFLILCFWLPESPRFDVVIGKRQRAIATLTRVAENNSKTLPMGKLLVHDQCTHGQFKDLFTPHYWKTTLLLWLIMYTKNFCYYGLILMTMDLFKARDSCGAHQEADVKLHCSLECKYLTSADYENLLWTTIAEVPGILGLIVTIDYIGRKKTMALCFVMFSLCIVPLWTCIGKTAVTICLFFARAFITGGFQAYYVYIAEAYPTENRSLAMGAANAAGKVGGLTTPFIAQVLFGTSINLTLAVYFGCSLLAALASLILPIETSGKRLGETKLH